MKISGIFTFLFVFTSVLLGSFIALAYATTLDVHTGFAILMFFTAWVFVIYMGLATMKANYKNKQDKDSLPEFTTSQDVDEYSSQHWNLLSETSKVILADRYHELLANELQQKKLYPKHMDYSDYSVMEENYRKECEKEFEDK
jgi:hypothetical protein